MPHRIQGLGRLPRNVALRLLHSKRFLVEMVARGHSVREVADYLGVHRSTVREEFRRLGVYPVVRPVREVRPVKVRCPVAKPR